jgi:hypothetical protein
MRIAHVLLRKPSFPRAEVVPKMGLHHCEPMPCPIPPTLPDCSSSPA